MANSDWEKCECCGRYVGTKPCRYCGKRYKTPWGLENHEKICFRNPQRQCPTCGGRGFLEEIEFGYGVHRWPCHHCELAKALQQEQEMS
jgi:hypothetical protein